MDHPFGKKLKVNPENITYGYESFHGFDVRIVYLNGSLKSEYHVKSHEDIINNEELLIILRKSLSKDCEVGFVDRTGIITLEFPIYIIVKNPILVDEMPNVWIDIQQIVKKENS